MQRVKVTIRYDGAAFAGWQLQTRIPQPTVQGVLEGVLYRLAGERVVVHGSGRTDTGVHAEGQVFHFDVPAGRETMDWERYFTAMLPPAVQVVSVEPVENTFHARYSAAGKQYAYCLWGHKKKAPPKLAPYVWSVPPVCMDSMQEAAQLLIGQHDFASFQKRGTLVESTVRTITAIEAEKGVCGPFRCPDDFPVWTWWVDGDGFLRQMVRNIIGLLVWVGQGKVQTADIPRMMQACDRKALVSPAAPAHGLTLVKVYYP